jgi:hypothetical protein
MASESLFSQVLGETFGEMPAAIRQIHNGRDQLLVGRCTVERGTGLWSRIFAYVASLPAAGDDQSISVNIACSSVGERWVRMFSGKKMISTLTCKRGLLVENLGPMKFAFRLDYNAITQEIHWLLRGVKLVGIPLPLHWFSSVAARESCVSGRYQFDVSASLPLIGLLVHYQGWLSVQ